MKKRLSPVTIEVTAEITDQFHDCMEDCKRGRVSMETRQVIAKGVLDVLDSWKPRLKYAERCEILDWVQANFGLCL